MRKGWGKRETRGWDIIKNIYYDELKECDDRSLAKAQRPLE